ncbi:MAG: transposase [Acetobacteraceae bacterium]|nr:transposase [Acetobacteraceae bacterium]
MRGNHGSPVAAAIELTMAGSASRARGARQRAAGCSLDAIRELIDWAAIEEICAQACVASRDGPWPPLALFRALLLAAWHNLSEVNLAQALEDRASFRRFCGFSASEPTPDGAALVRFRTQLIGRDLEQLLFALLSRQLEAKGVAVRTGTLVDASLIGSAWIPHDEGEHDGCGCVHGSDAQVAIRNIRSVEVTTAGLCGIAGPMVGPRAEPADAQCDGGLAQPFAVVRDGRPYTARSGAWGGLKNAIVDRLHVERAYVLGRRNRAGFQAEIPIGVERRGAPIGATLIDAAEPQAVPSRALPYAYRDSRAAVRQSRGATVVRGVRPIAQTRSWGGSGRPILLRLFSELGSVLFRAQIAATLVSLSIIGVLAIASLWR